MATRFESKKSQILRQLNKPANEYHDLSPKGSVDVPILPLIKAVNQTDGLVTTSSCSGRLSIFLEGRKRVHGNPEGLDGSEAARAGPGGKGGGSWLFISHDPHDAILDCSAGRPYMSTFGLQEASSAIAAPPDPEARYIHLKFEPMILHVLTASIDHSQLVLTAALSSGFRESGAVGLAPSRSGETNPMVAIRTTGYAYDTIIGYQDQNGINVSLVDESYLRILVSIANERFAVNTARIERLRLALLKQFSMREVYPAVSSTNNSVDRRRSGWEDTETRKKRLKQEGLARQHALQIGDTATKSSKHLASDWDEHTSLGDIFH